jgi:DNA-binding FrmR family transcriptional regulator
MDIMKQIKAVQQALERVSALTLENHLNTCVTTAIRSEDSAEQDRVVREIMDVFKATGKL